MHLATRFKEIKGGPHIEHSELIELQEHFRHTPEPDADVLRRTPLNVRLFTSELAIHRYPWHNAFLRKHGKKIRSFADIGPALVKGAPTTIEAKNALPHARVVAFDARTAPLPEQQLKSRGIGVRVHSIIEKPLGEKFDAIRFAWVSNYLTIEEKRKAMRHIFESLNEGGYLLNENAIFQKTRNGFRLVAKGER